MARRRGVGKRALLRSQWPISANLKVRADPLQAREKLARQVQVQVSNRRREQRQSALPLALRETQPPRPQERPSAPAALDSEIMRQPRDHRGSRAAAPGGQGWQDGATWLLSQ